MGLWGPRLPAFEVLQVRLMVATDLVDAVTAELLEEGVHEHDGHHRFPDHARGGDRTGGAAPAPPTARARPPRPPPPSPPPRPPPRRVPHRRRCARPPLPPLPGCRDRRTGAASGGSRSAFWGRGVTTGGRWGRRGS